SQPYGSAPPYGEAEPAVSVARPRVVDGAFWLTIAAAALSLLSLALSFGNIDAARQDALRQLQSQGQENTLTPEAIEAMFVGSLVVGTVFTLLFAAAYVVFAVLMRKGHGWARWLIASFAALSFFGVVITLLIDPASLGIGLLPLLCLAAATVLAFLPQSKGWFRAMAANRSMRRV
ncbi:MAG: hypothetical protein M3116_07645, partial [Actinomycetota bacterium]|nr:hypothetical protein [Actinomycetota bacterium]